MQPILVTRTLTRRSVLKTSANLGAAAAIAQSFPLSARAAGPSLAGVTLGDSPQDVLRKRGVPTSELYAHGSGVPEWVYPGVVVRFASLNPAARVVKSTHILDRRGGPGPFGLAIGATLTDLSRVYGPQLMAYSGGGGYYVPLSQTVRVDFVMPGTEVVAIVLSDASCVTCSAPSAARAPGPKKK